MARFCVLNFPLSTKIAQKFEIEVHFYQSYYRPVGIDMKVDGKTRTLLSDLKVARKTGGGVETHRTECGASM
jgi:hypothetical protein